MNTSSDFDRELLDDTLYALADQHRRLVMQYLKEVSDGTASIDALTEYVAKRSTGDHTPADVSIRLHHVVLPKLEEADIVEYDPRSKSVRYQSNPVAEQVLTSLPSTND